MQTTVTRSRPAAVKAPQFRTPKTAPRFSMDMLPPHRVYVDGRVAGEFESEEAAAQHFLRLRRAANIELPAWQTVRSIGCSEIAPFTVWVNGEVVADHGDNEDAALAHYQLLSPLVALVRNHRASKTDPAADTQAGIVGTRKVVA